MSAGAVHDRQPLDARESAAEGARPAERSAGPGGAYSPIVLAGVVRVLEVMLLAGVGFGLHELYVVPNNGRDLTYIVLIPWMALTAVVALQTLRLYTVTALRSPVRQRLRILGAWTFVFVVALAAMFFLKLDWAFSRVWLAGYYVSGLVALALERFALAALVRTLSRMGKFDRRTAIVGGGAAAEPVLRALARAEDGDISIIGVFDDRADDRSPNVVAGYPKLGTISDLVEFARHSRLDLVIFTLPITAETRLLEMLRKLWVLPVDIRLAAHSHRLRFHPQIYSYIGELPVIDVFDKPIAHWDVLVKAAFDRFVGAVLLAAFAPLMAIIALAVRLDSRGPVLFRQRRYGFNNESIEVFKFRTMFVDRLDPAASRLVTRDDPRVTRIGQFLRRSSLDELPQLFNVVFRGDLSLVGPRPHAPQARAADKLYDDVVDGYFARHRVKPGLTGWAQINGWRGETDTPEKIQKRVEHDLDYIENWSLLRDLYILLLTPVALIKGQNAY
ncbi:MAG TPA: undecaprenyl-phosphate glucose phosphotransferase [Methylocystis sp.]|nr:undecaprenyl-phosphate glucose phosphotransferase [Methylocystis sp.]